jgi:outer membrane protein
MKKTYTLLAVVCCLAGATLLLKDTSAQTTPSASAPMAKVAICDIQEIFANYNKAKDLLAQLNDNRQAVNAEVEKRGKAIDALQMELEGLKQGSKEYEARAAEIQRQTIDRAVYKQFQDSQILHEHRKLTVEMYNETVKMIAKVAKEQGYNLVLYREHELVETEDMVQLFDQIRSHKVLYSDESLDITKDVLAKLNEAYKGGGK